MLRNVEEQALTASRRESAKMQIVIKMLSGRRYLLIAAVAIFGVPSSQGLSLDLEDLERRASWQPPSLEAIEQQIDRWIHRGDGSRAM